jgi:hypothetical protein
MFCFWQSKFNLNCRTYTNVNAKLCLKILQKLYAFKVFSGKGIYNCMHYKSLARNIRFLGEKPELCFAGFDAGLYLFKR